MGTPEAMMTLLEEIGLLSHPDDDVCYRRISYLHAAN